jgi:hypothetical protein
MMCSAQVLEEKVQEFSKKNNIDEGQLWQTINNIHTKQFGRNLMWEKQEFEKNNNCGDVPMAEQFAKENLVHRAIEIIKGLEVCILEGYPLE